MTWSVLKLTRRCAKIVSAHAQIDRLLFSTSPTFWRLIRLIYLRSSVKIIKSFIVCCVNIIITTLFPYLTVKKTYFFELFGLPIIAQNPPYFRSRRQGQQTTCLSLDCVL